MGRPIIAKDVMRYRPTLK